VWNVENSYWDAERTALEGINCYETFLQSIGLKTSLRGIGIQDDRIDEMASKCTDNDKKTVGNFVKLGKKDVYNILKLAK
jgi:alcohol dehydrogenase YqhD (iron-dependent ADH family)